jgi:hypothetical protein
LLANIAHFWARLVKSHRLHIERIAEHLCSHEMPKTRKNHRGKSHNGRKRAERWFKRVLTAAIKREEERSRKELTHMTKIIILAILILSLRAASLAQR